MASRLEGLTKERRSAWYREWVATDVIERGMFLCGSAATLREKIEKYQKEIGLSAGDQRDCRQSRQ